MENISLSIDEIPDCAIYAAKTGRVLIANEAAKSRFKQDANMGAFAPWFENRHGWSFCERLDGSVLGVFRPDADETARAKTMLFATLSHEIRTPLNGILGMAGLLGMSELSSSQRSWLQSVEDSGQHLLSLLNDILDYAKLESGKIELEKVVFDPVHTMQSIAEILSPRAHEKGLEIAVIKAKNVPNKVAGDDGRLRQIILNLASNAVKFTQDGGVLIRISVPRVNYLRFAVEDTGIGVPQAKIDTIFEEFTQADSSHTRQFGGTGLGLAIVKRLTNAMGGEVFVKANEKGGTIFYVDIPFETIESNAHENSKVLARKIAIAIKSDILFEAIKANLEELGAMVVKINNENDIKGASVLLLDNGIEKELEQSLLNAKIPVVALIEQEKRDLIETYRNNGVHGYLIKPLRIGSMIERIGLAANYDGNIIQNTELSNDERAQTNIAKNGIRILLAEDNRINALLAKSLLERFGCDVVAVGNGREAFEAVQGAPYDLVFMDFHMPIMDGLEATKQIRALGSEYSKIPIIALTAAAMEEDRRACIAAGMVDFITKPLEISALQKIMIKWTSAYSS